MLCICAISSSTCKVSHTYLGLDVLQPHGSNRFAGSVLSTDNQSHFCFLQLSLLHSYLSGVLYPLIDSSPLVGHDYQKHIENVQMCFFLKIHEICCYQVKKIMISSLEEEYTQLVGRIYSGKCIQLQPIVICKGSKSD